MSDKKIKYVIFDLDGVLVDATEWHYEALNRALKLFGHEISRYEHLSAYNGLPTRKKLEMLTLEKGFPQGLHGLVNRLKQVLTINEIRTHCVPHFDKEYMLARLAREGYRLAVCSNSIRETLELMLRESGIIDYFDFILSNEDVKHPKPDPQIYLAAFERFGCTADQVVIVEDAPHGVEAARRSGAHVCVVEGFDEVNYFRVAQAVSEAEGHV